MSRIGRKATLKLDLIIMPAMVIMYILNYLDRQNIASAKLANIERDLNLSDVEYQTCVSLLFVGYSMSHNSPCPAGITWKDLLIVRSPDAGSFKHVRGQVCIPSSLHLPGHGHLGCHFCVYGRSTQL